MKVNLKYIVRFNKEMFTPKDLEHDFSCKTMSNLFWKINKRKLYMEPAVAYKRLKNFIVCGFFPTSVTKCKTLFIAFEI